MTKSDLATPGTVVRRFSTKAGQKGLIRVIEPGDLDALLEYANSLIAEDIYVALSGRPLTAKYELAYLKKTIREIKIGRKVHLVLLVDNRFAGSFEVRVRERRSAHVGEIGIGLAGEFRAAGLGVIAMETLIESAKVLGLRLLTLTCFAANDRAIALYRKMGFIEGGRIPGMYSYRGHFETEVIMYRQLTGNTA